MIPLRDDVEAQSAPVINVLLIAANIAAFLWMFTMPEAAITKWCIVPHRFLTQHSLDQIVTIFTAMFMHAGPAHLIGNMWFLWIFGDNVEDRMGHFEYLLFYLICGLGGSLVHIYVDPASTVPCLGASGAIAGVMGGYLVLFPSAKIRVMLDDFWLWSFRWPAWLVIGEWWVLQYVLGVVIHETSSHIGYFAHLGGFAVGMVLVMLFAKREPALTSNVDLAYEKYCRDQDITN
ncbi:MAG TPA: rhomboid family intramembrane serine protease [Candidatus Obscuribacterales bacterium]